MRSILNPNFESYFGRSPQLSTEAYGRVNLIGEHTDYNGGFVLPEPIPQKTTVDFAANGGRQVRLKSTAIETVTFQKAEYMLGEEKRCGKWWDYIQGITWELLRQGYHVEGFDAWIDSTVPIGGGLSSSAALEVSMLRAIRSAFMLPLSDPQLARIGQMAENQFVGARVGIMDQMCAAVGKRGFALFLDTRLLDFEHIPVPGACKIGIVNSGIHHDLRSGYYNIRRRECEEACKLLNVSQLRDLRPEDSTRIEKLPDPLSRRVRHVLSENKRVIDAVDALRRSDLAALGQLFYASHESMRTDYEVSLPPIDLLVQLGRKHSSVYGARLTGGGFGGSVIFLIDADSENVLQEITQEYKEQTGYTSSIIFV